MASQGMQMVGMVMTLTGWFMVIVVCAMPTWKVSAFVGANIVTAQTIWEGLWMTCVVQSTGQMQCKVYDSMLALPQDLQAARAMVIISILTGIFGILLSIAGGKCTNCIVEEASKAKACIAAGILFIVSGILCLVPVSWSANTIISNFYNPMLVETQRRELGAALYIGWGAASVLLMGGGLLCWNCPPKEDRHRYVPKFTPVRSSSRSREYQHSSLLRHSESTQLPRARAKTDFSLPSRTQSLSRAMGRICKETTGQVIIFIGLVGLSLTCGLPMWRVTTYIGANIVTGQVVWDGLWMNCVMQSTGQMQCKINDSILLLTQDLQAARALVIIGVIFGFVGFGVSFLGTSCTSSLKSDGSKAKVVILAGCLVFVAAILLLIPISWSATVTINDFLSPLTITTQKREIGASIYIGWGSTVLLLIGGSMLCSSCPPQEPMYGYPGYGPAPMYPYSGPMVNTGPYGRVYAPPPPGTYSATGSYAPNKQYARPYSTGQY
ncbi:uncharacterized protein FYW47_017263 [Aplochiton taeniatus]